MIKKILDSFKNEQKDVCVLCRKETKYNIDTPIKDRYFYVETAGQLCPKCFYINYG